MNLKQKKITIIKLIVIMAVTFLFLFILNNSTLAATISSDIDGIDESKYPGYKERIKQLQSIYPNIQVLYTGLDWNTVIYNEHEETHGRNLVSTSMDDAWVCQECKNAGKTYDSGLYCASEQAIEYLMDPRNSLTQTGIFQFQKLNTAVGTDPNEISILLQMEHVDYLKNDPNVIQAFANVAKNNNLNAYFLISRVIQEQGRAPTSPLATGAGYTGNGYTEYGKGYYNLFSIGATRANGEESYMTRVNALTRAMDEGWDSLAKSIEGGGNFVGNTYIDVGQNTLYLQKFDVYNTNEQLYWHQYMQNLFGAQSEAQILYGLYQINGIQNSKDFVFIVPIYENMPSTPAQEPTSEYYGTINTDLKTMEVGKESDGRYYIKGNVLIAEWINGVANVPSELPEMTIKSTDGTFSTGVNLVHTEGLNYTYYRIIDNLDINKEYYLEATLTSKYNLSNNKTQTVNMPELTVGEYKGTTIKTKNNKIYFSVGGYVGDINTDLKSISLNKNDSDRYYLYGNMLVAEWIDGTAYTPKSLPQLKLKSTDGTVVVDMYISYLEGLNYYYDVFIDDIDLTKQYYIEASLAGEDNIGTNVVQHVLLPEQELGEFKDRTLITEDNLIKPTFDGTINTDLKTMNLALNEAGREYISGDILIAEWIDGVAYEPQGLPEMTLKSTDGTYSAGFHLVHNEGLSYSYDRVVYNLSENKEYYIEVKLTGENNIGENKTQKVKIPNGEVGQVGSFRLMAEDNNLRVEDGSLYKGDINTDLKTMNLSSNTISGDILIAEWIDSVANEPQGLPKMTLKSTDGTYSKAVNVTHNSGLDYSYNVSIADLDTSKTYYIEVELTGEKNIGTNKVQKANLNAKSEVGEFKGKVLTIANNEITFRGNEYEGEINTDLKAINLALNGAGKEYVYGNILIAEWINGVAYEPKEMPEMTIKSTDGTYSAGFYLRHEEGLSYYYDRVVYNLDPDKEYYIEVKLTNENNISSKKTQTVKLTNGTIGQVGSFKLVAEDNKMKLEDGSYYRGDINTDLKTMNLSSNTISGDILIAEWIDSVANEPQGLPKMTLKSTDGVYSKEVNLVHNSGLDYSYNVNIAGIDTSKTYYIEVELTGEKNIGANKVQKANLNAESEVGEYNGKTLMLANNEITFKGHQYEGEINTDLKTMKLEENKISGEILIAEWIDGVANVPSKLPEMTLKSVDETYSKEMKLTHEGGLSYNYEVEIEDLDTSKEYYIEVRLTDENNVSTKTTQTANLNAESEVGIFKDTSRLVLRDNKMVFEPIETKILMKAPKVNEQEDVKQDENKVETEQIEITDNQEEVKGKKKVEEIPDGVEEEQNEKEENLIENTNILENVTNIIDVE